MKLDILIEKGTPTPPTFKDYVRVTPDGWAIATNSKSIVFLYLEEYHGAFMEICKGLENDIFFTKKEWKQIRKAKYLVKDEGKIIIFTSDEKREVITPTVGIKWPDIKEVLPSEWTPQEKPVSLNFRMIAKMQKAMDVISLNCFFNGNEKGFICTALGHEKTFSMHMPMPASLKPSFKIPYLGSVK